MSDFSYRAMNARGHIVRGQMDAAHLADLELRLHRLGLDLVNGTPVRTLNLGKYLNETRGLPTVEVKTEFHSTWLDNTKAKFLLGWRAEYDLKKMIDAAFDYVRAEDDPRKIWYPG